MSEQTPDEFMQAYEGATNRHDLEGLLTLVDEEAVYLFSDESVYVGKTAISEALRRNFGLIQNEAYQIMNLTWLAQSEEVSACVYDFAWSGMIRGKPASGSGRGTTVLRRTRGAWKVVHEHLSKGAFGGGAG